MGSPGYDRQNDLNDVLTRTMYDANLTPPEREYVLATVAAALMETYQHGYWDGSNNLGSKVRESDLEDRPTERDIDPPTTEERDTSRDWSYEPTVGELGIANPPQLGPEDYADWESEGGNGHHR